MAVRQRSLRYGVLESRDGDDVGRAGGGKVVHQGGGDTRLNAEQDAVE